MSRKPNIAMSSTTSTRGPYRTGIKRRQQIIENASAAFALHGYAGATLRQIADRVGVTPGAVLAHFKDKEELLLAVLDKWTQDARSLRHSDATGLDWFLGYPNLIRYQMKHPGLNELFLTLCTEAWDPAHPAHEWVSRHYEDLLDEAVSNLRTAVAAGDIAPLNDSEIHLEARCLYATMDGLQLQWLGNRSFDVAQYFAEYFDITLSRWRAVRRPASSGDRD